MRSMGSLWGCKGALRDSMGVYGVPMGLCGGLWVSGGVYGVYGVSMGV